MKPINFFLKTTLPLACFLFMYLSSCAQVGDMPQFKITKADGKIFKAAELKSGKPTLLIYFSPECDHCQVFMKEFFKKAASFKKANVLMITFLPADRVVTFVKEYPTRNYPNITVGTEGMTFVVRNKLGIQNMPYAALFDKKNKLVSTYERGIPLDAILSSMKKME